MSWGPSFFYYHCSACGHKFKVETALIPVLGDAFGLCPRCGRSGVYEKDGARSPDDADYEEIDEDNSWQC